MNKKIVKLFKNEDGFGSLIETLVGSIIMVIGITGAGLVINNALQVNLQSLNQNKAATIINDVFNDAKGLEYSQLAVYNTNFPARDDFSIVGCENVLNGSFENETEITTTSESIGLPFCVKEKQPNGKGISFNVETHVTNVGINGINNDLNGLNSLSINGFYGKRVTVIVTWYEGEKDSNELPVMVSAQSEMTFAPSLGDCVPYATTGTGACI